MNTIRIHGWVSLLLTVRALAAPPTTGLTCDRDEVFAGERVVVHGDQVHDVRIPADARPGQRIWIQREGAWLDFTVVPLVDLDLALAGEALQVELTSNAPRPDNFEVLADGKQQRVRLPPRQPTTVVFDLAAPAEESAAVIPVAVRLGEMTQRREVGLRAVRELQSLGPLPKQFTVGMRMRGHPETAAFRGTGTIVEPRETSSGNVAKEGWFMHPPWQGGVGYCFATLDPFELPAEPAAALRAYVGKGDGSDLGDGIRYRVAVVDDQGAETVVAEQTVTRHEWRPVTADLSRWAGRRIALKLIADVGPRDNSSGDWGCWGDLRLETVEPRLHYVLESNVETLRREPGPHPVAGVSAAELRRARSGRLHYEGKGLAGGGRYATFGSLNGIDIGPLTPAGGDEARGVFSGDVSMPLSATALRTLNRRNRLAIRNPHGDSFSVRRVWIELELADGRRCSSDIATATYTQPSSWAYAEGIGVPFGRNVALEIWFGR